MGFTVLEEEADDEEALYDNFSDWKYAALRLRLAAY